MSKYERDYCDCCGKLLYHALHSTGLKYKKVRITVRKWWWNGTPSYETSDICDDCTDVIGHVVAYQRNKVDKLKEAGLDKSPAQQMQKPPEPLTRALVRKALKSDRL